jgi:hypothetical protein
LLLAVVVVAALMAAAAERAASVLVRAYLLPRVLLTPLLLGLVEMVVLPLPAGQLEAIRYLIPLPLTVVVVVVVPPLPRLV